MMRLQLNMPDLPPGYWATIPTKYNKGILTCPSLKPGGASGAAYPVFQLEVHYGMPRYNIGGQNWGGLIAYKKEPEIRRPSEQIVFVDSTGGPLGFGGFSFINNPGLGFVDFRHSKMVNCAFVDGHIEARNRNQLDQGVSDWVFTTPGGGGREENTLFAAVVPSFNIAIYLSG